MLKGSRNEDGEARSAESIQSKLFRCFSANDRVTPREKYLLTVLLVALTTGLHWLLAEYLDVRYAYILYYPAVILAALVGGFGPGLFATALSGLATCLLFLPPVGLSVANPHDALALGIFYLNGVFITLLAHAVRKSSEKAQNESGEKTRAYDRLIKETKERERLEEHLRQAHKMEAVGTLAGGIAHDFNNMLAVIIGNAELVLDDVGKHSGPARNIEQIISASMRTRDLIRQILTFSRKTEQGKSPLNLTPLIKEIYNLLRHSLPTTIEMSLDIKTEYDTILGDPSQVQQVLLNLASNAGYAMRDKGGKLVIGLSDVMIASDEEAPEADMQPGRYLKLTVKDTGTGMTEVVKKKLFEPFFTTKEVGQGTGMGLAVVYGIVKSHGGAISVESKIGEGSSFVVFLPHLASAVQEEHVQEKPVPHGDEKILVVDDEPAVAQMVSDMLGRLGYEVTTEMDSAHALTIFLSEPYRFDLVVTDHVMPGITGIDLAQKMIEVRKDVPIILITGYSETASPERAKSVGISEFVMKPLHRQEMAEIVREVLDRAGKNTD